MKPPTHPLVIVGLDGGSFNLIDRLFARGDMPHLQTLAEGGLRTDLLSTLPVATLPAWTTFLTACEPARHGVTDLLVADGGYGLTPASGTLRTEPTFLARLSARGLAVASLGVPGTFPPEPIPGICIAGFDAPGARTARPEAMWPRTLHRTLRPFGGWQYATFNEHRPQGAHIEAAVQALCADLRRKQAIILHLLASRRWDVFFVHLQASDTAAHHLWHTFDAASPRALPGHANALPRVYRCIDGLLGALRAAAPPSSRFLVVSDHGMGGAAAEAVYLNRFLHQAGVLRFYPRRLPAVSTALRRGLGALPLGTLGAALRWSPAPVRRVLMAAARNMAMDPRCSDAFSYELDYAPAIWLNRRDAFPHGRLDPAAADALQSRLACMLADLQIHSERLFYGVHRRQDLPEGRHAGRLPDLILEPAWPGGYRPSFLASGGPGPWLQRLPATAFAAPRGSGMPGVHRREGMFVAHGPGLPAMEVPALHMCQAGAAVYALLGLPVPTDLDGRLPDYLMDLLQASPQSPCTEAVRAADPYATTQRDDLLAKLGAMGYF